MTSFDIDYTSRDIVIMVIIMIIIIIIIMK